MRRALADVHADLGRLRRVVTEEDARSGEQRRAAELDARAGVLLAQLQRLLAQQHAALVVQGEREAAAAAAAVAEVTAARSALGAAEEAKSEGAARVQSLEAGRGRSTGGGGVACAPGAVCMRALQEAKRRCTALRNELAARASQEQSVAASAAALAQAQGSVASARAAAALLTEQRAQLQQSLGAARDGAAGAAALQQQLADLEARLVVVAGEGNQLAALLEAEQAALGQAQQDFTTARADAHRTAHQLDAQSSAACGDASSVVAVATTALQEAEHKLQQAQLAAATARARAASAAATATAGSAHAALLTRPGSTAGARPLSACFELRNPEGARRLSRALAAVAGGSLDVLVVPDAAGAAALLDAHRARARAGDAAGKLRVWPLDRLAAPDRRRAQREAASALPAGRLMLPLDLVTFAPEVEPAMLRAFGAMLIAADDAAAGEAAARFGLGAVTLDGTVHHKGSVSGGWAGADGGGSWGAARWQVLAQRDTAAQAARAAEMAAAAAEQRHAVAARAAAQAQRAARELAGLAATAAATDAALGAAEARVNAAAERAVSAQAALDEARVRAAALAAARDECALLQAAARCEHGGAGAEHLARLQQSLAALEVREANAAEELERAETQVRGFAP